jgi:hypothetical protein
MCGRSCCRPYSGVFVKWWLHGDSLGWHKKIPKAVKRLGDSLRSERYALAVHNDNHERSTLSLRAMAKQRTMSSLTLSSTMAHKKYRYQSAVYLNNTAVTILSHGHCVAAMEALTDALLLLKSLAQYECESSITTMQLDALAKSSVATAQRHLASVTTTTASETLNTTDRSNLAIFSPQSQQRPPLHVVEYNGSLPSSLISFIDCNKNAPDQKLCTGLAMLLETNVDEDVEDDRHATEIAPAIVLSNFALAHWHASLSSHCSHASRQSNRTTAAALRLLDMAQSVLGVQKRTMQVNEGNMFLALVIVHNTFGIQSMACRPNHLANGPQRYPPPDSFSTAISLLQYELDLLCALSRQMTLVTSALQPVVAGAA